MASLKVLCCAAMLSLTIATAAARADPPTAPGPFVVVSQSAVFDPATRRVTFSLAFNRAPDFQTVDEFNRQADSFQYFIVGDPALPYPDNFDSIIRAEELHVSSDGLRIRNSVGPDPDPAAGGWGAIRDVVPYRLRGNVMTFSTTLAQISDHSSDGRFSYQLETYQYGGLTGAIQGQSVVASPVEIDIKPHSSANRINPRGNRRIAVAILTSSGFDATRVDPASVRFGPRAAQAVHRRVRVRDVDRDGDADLVLRFRIRDTGIKCGDVAASLTGKTSGGEVITGTDALATVGCGPR